MINNKETYNKAKNECEPLLQAILSGLICSIDGHDVSFRKIVLVPDAIDYEHHLDVLAEGYYIVDGVEHHSRFTFDAKDVSDKNVGSGNFTLRKTCIQHYASSDDQNSFIAFRLNDKSGRMNEFIVVDAREICSKYMNDVDEWSKVPLEDIARCKRKFYAKSDF